MTSDEFYLARGKLGKTQEQLAELLGVSLRTVHSYEQGWRNIPEHTEKLIYFLLIKQKARREKITPCWEIKNCQIKDNCPAWEFDSGHLCWYLCGTLCDCSKDICRIPKMLTCKSCDIFKSLLR